ncbi:MAG: BlaI/MecI/CopY family transcriptional regulator [Lachnospiraceae bacterium]
MQMMYLTECEQVVMKSVWDAGKDVSLQEIMRDLEDRFHKVWKRQTISTFLLHLIEKGYLKSYRQGRVFYYVSQIDEADYRDTKNKEFLDFWYTGSVADMVKAMMEKGSIAAEELEKLKGLI